MNNEQKEQMIKTNAFDGVSFDPEKRLERFISDIESEDNKIDELCQQYGIDSQKLKEYDCEDKAIAIVSGMIDGCENVLEGLKNVK